MSCAQSDFVNVEDSISQIDFSGLVYKLRFNYSDRENKLHYKPLTAVPPPKTPTLPKALAEITSEVSQSTEKLLAIRPQSIIINPQSTFDQNSLVSLQTEHMAAEFNRVQRSMDVNFGMTAKSTFSGIVFNSIDS